MKKTQKFYKWPAALLLGFFLLTGCAHLRTSKNDQANNGTPHSVKDVLSQNIDSNSSPSSAQTTFQPGENVVAHGVQLKNTHFDIPITVNSRVEYWIDYFMGRGRPFFEKYLERSVYFVPYITPLLKQNGLPEDIVYLAMIESGFNNHARSRAAAVGPWQFIKATGKRYGLMVNWWVDERRDIRKSTLAAVEYLRDLYQMFNSWELAASAYNAGEVKIQRAVRRFGTTDFWEISRHRFLRPETRDYVPKIIAAAIISKNPEQFGFKVENAKPAADEAVAGDGQIVKVIKTDKPEETINDVIQDSKDVQDSQGSVQASNDVDQEDDFDDEDGDQNSSVSSKDPVPSPGITPATLTVPPHPNESGDGKDTMANNDPQPLAKPVPTPHVTKDGHVAGEALAEFEVKSPADLLKIARAAGLSYQTVKSLNPELNRWCTPPTVGSYRIRLPSSTKEKFLATYNHVAFPRDVEFMTYKVHRGETLNWIARHFGIKVDPISDLNGVSPHLPLKSGIHVLLPIPNDRSRTLASLDLRDPPERRHHRRHRRRYRSRYYKITYKRREAAREYRSSNDGG